MVTCFGANWFDTVFALIFDRLRDDSLYLEKDTQLGHKVEQNNLFSSNIVHPLSINWIYQ